MKRKIPACLVLCCFLIPLAGRAQSSLISAPARSAVETGRAAGWTFEARFQSDSRELKAGNTVVDLGMARLVARAGVDILPYLQLAVDAGWNRAELDGEEGEGGLLLGAGLRMNVYEYVIEASPVLGRKQTIKLGAAATYARGESNFGATDFDWAAVTVAPWIAYTRNVEGPDNWRPYAPSGVAVYGGLVWASIDADYGDVGLDENRNFALLLGGDMRMYSDVSFNLEVQFFTEGDVSSSVAIGYHF
ncbi:MAG: hypothetical protein JXR37_18440 [Kiritimatiellae bacterium]|nr:hypothetical protein [Kiritimatiellia bacterium]